MTTFTGCPGSSSGAFTARTSAFAAGGLEAAAARVGIRHVDYTVVGPQWSCLQWPHANTAHGNRHRVCGNSVRHRFGIASLDAVGCRAVGRASHGECIAEARAIAHADVDRGPAVRWVG
jgi:hypothetical protein